MLSDDARFNELFFVLHEVRRDLDFISRMMCVTLPSVRDKRDGVCPYCGHDHGILVGSGVDEHGEWRSNECCKCHSVWIWR